LIRIAWALWHVQSMPRLSNGRKPLKIQTETLPNFNKGRKVPFFVNLTFGNQQESLG